MADFPRLIEHAFPLKQASLDSVREKYGPRGHISGFHLWPARRPLAASRAALIATLLPDPGSPEERNRLAEKIGGRVVRKAEKKKVAGKTVEVEREETIGGVLHWGRESSPDLEWFRQEIRKAYGGRAPKVLDPFAGGGAIPLEAMRLGCEATAMDINPVAWFILKCTLEYPQRLAGQHRPLPKFALESPEFMEGFFRGTGKLTKRQLDRNLEAVQQRMFPEPDVDLSWHVRAWGWWVLQGAKADLEKFYPTIDGQSTVAYLWARIVTCKNCRATIPLLKTRWLCKKDNKRVLLVMEPKADRTGVVFAISTGVPVVGGNAAQRREHDKRIGQGTMSRAGAWCPCCGKPGTVSMRMEDIRQEGVAARLSTAMTAVVVDGPEGKEYRLPYADEVRLPEVAKEHLELISQRLPFGLPEEPLPSKEALGFRVPLYGFDKWCKLSTPRQLLALGTFIRHMHRIREEVIADGYPREWVEALCAYLASSLDRLVDHSTTLATWYLPGENVKHTFVRYALPITWDFAESNPIYSGGGSWTSAVGFCAAALGHTLSALRRASRPDVTQGSAISGLSGVAPRSFDLIVTDPPYYDAIPYSDLMDCFYIWLRRSMHHVGGDYERFGALSVSPKWDERLNDGELIDDSSRHGGDAAKSKATYEDGMLRAFKACHEMLVPDGRMVIVFANKQPDAWETLVSAMIRAGFVVDASWPIQTENVTRSRARASAALASSVWLVCRKRVSTAKPGWDNQILDEMRGKIYGRLSDYWDAGIRGPDFVWAATGPALEVYSEHPVVKKANEPNRLMEVAEFLRTVRRIVVDFVIGRVLTKGDDQATIGGLDDVTTYYLLHRHDFGIDDAPIGPCILYAVSCGVSDRDLTEDCDILVRTGGQAEAEDDADEAVDEEGDAEDEEGTGSRVRLRPWQQRKAKGMGYDVNGRPAPLIDQVHRLMQLWKAGDVVKVEEYLDERGLRKNALFHQLLQALIELAGQGTEERSLLESISNHVSARGVSPEDHQLSLTPRDGEGV